MHPELSEFSSQEFYEGKIKNGISKQNRTHDHINFKWPNSDCPMFFQITTGVEETPPDSKSHYNMFIFFIILFISGLNVIKLLILLLI